MQNTESVFVFGRIYFRHDMARRFLQHLRYFLKKKNFDWLASICLQVKNILLIDKGQLLEA